MAALMCPVLSMVRAVILSTTTNEVQSGEISILFKRRFDPHVIRRTMQICLHSLIDQ